MSQPVQAPIASENYVQQATSHSNNGFAVSDAQLRAAAKVIDAYVNKTQVRARPAVSARSTGVSAALGRHKSQTSQRG